MKTELERYLPLGRDGKQTRDWLIFSLAVSALWSLWCFLGQYWEEYQTLFYYNAVGERIVNTRAVMVPFRDLLYGVEKGFGLVLAAMPALAVFHYLHHWQGSKSIYLMRRLPDPWELHRRCLAVPFTGAVACMALLGLMCVVFYLIYILCTPQQCLPV